MTINQLIVRLAELICDAFEEEQFSMLLFENVEEKEFDYLSDAKGDTYKARVFFTVRWANRTGQVNKVLWLAQKVAGLRAGRADLHELAAQIGAAAAPAAAAPGANGLPNELSVGITLLEQQLPKPLDHARDLRDLLRKKDCRAIDLPGRFHLSDRDIERLVTVLALEAAPTIRYIRWLAERLVVEPPFIAFMAAKAMTTAMLRLGGDELQRAISAARNAEDLLDGLVDADDATTTSFGLAARKEQLASALMLAEMRTKQGKFLLPASDLEAFLNELITLFNRDTFDLMCRNGLQTASKFLGAHPHDPMELIAIQVFLTCRGKWERELIQAAQQAQPASPVFQNLRQKFAAAAAG
ncbi:MAG TPA: hypothetical protein VFB80_17560 [Pirellulaceae bacterium]|nr:hypothetical protein [Pirellulaceae bacterium]